MSRLLTRARTWSGRASVLAGSALLVAPALLAPPSTTPAIRPASSAPDLVLPDLVADPPTGSLIETYVDSDGTRLLLRFNGYVHNQGRGPLEIRGSEPDAGRMGVVSQRVYDTAGGASDLLSSPAPVVLFESTDSHNHWHLRDAARYSLWDESRAAEVAPAMKVGFCLLDSQRIDPWAPPEPAYTYDGISFCEQGDATTPGVGMGVTPGWRDVYGRALAFQWVDISDVLPGTYWLRSEVDPDGVVVESDEGSPPAFAAASTVVPGYNATSFAQRVPLGLGLPARVTLRAEQFGDPGPVRFKITRAPSHGTLDKTPGDGWFTGSTVQYTARFGYRGTDSFEYVAAGPGGFPRTPRTATVSLGVGVAPPAVTDSAYAGPTPLADDVRRAPDVDAALPRRADALLSTPQVDTHHGDLIVRSVAWRAGVVRVAVRAGSGPLGTCRVRTPVGRVVTCLFGPLAEEESEDATVTATLARGGRLLARSWGAEQ